MNFLLWICLGIVIGAAVVIVGAYILIIYALYKYPD